MLCDGMCMKGAFFASIPKVDNSISFNVGDALGFLKALPDEHVDMFLTDPPYASMERHRNQGVTTRLSQSRMSSNNWFPVVSDAYLCDCIKEMFRVLKSGRHVMMFADYWTTVSLQMLDKQTHNVLQRGPHTALGTKFRLWTPIVWEKLGRPGMGYHYRSQYEMVMFLEKGKRRLNDLSERNVQHVKPVQRGYPAEKPHELLSTLVCNSTQRGELVCDPFFGSGSTAVASYLLGRRFLGCDSSFAALEHANKAMLAVRESLKQIRCEGRRHV